MTGELFAWDLADPDLWTAVLAVIGVNLVLSGDNAIVIALACRGLPGRARRRAVWLATGGALGMRVVLTAVAAELLRLPGLRLSGGLLLGWVALKLLMPAEGEGSHGEACASLGTAVRTIVVADLVMSLDNVLGVAAAARGDLGLMVLGLLLSMPIIVLGSGVLIRLTARYPVIVPLGAALLAWVGGEMAVSEPVVGHWVAGHAPWLHWVLPAALAVAVVGLGAWMRRRHPLPVLDVTSVPHPGARARAPEPTGLAADGPCTASTPTE